MTLYFFTKAQIAIYEIECRLCEYKSKFEN
jgi:hypothetical protein